LFSTDLGNQNLNHGGLFQGFLGEDELPVGILGHDHSQGKLFFFDILHQNCFALADHTGIGQTPLTGLFIFLAFKADPVGLINRGLKQVKLNALEDINRKMQRNFFILQGLLLAKVWDDKYAMYKGKETAKYFSLDSPNRKLLLAAENIAKSCSIDLETQYRFLTYFYKDNNEKTIMGFIGFDDAGLSYKR